MRALVVYESMFGNTRTIAEAIATGLRSSGIDVDVVEVGSASNGPGEDVGLLVVGAPTHALSLSARLARGVEAVAAQGYRAAQPAESLSVSDTVGPLVEGEVERARRWGVELAASSLVGQQR